LREDAVGGERNLREVGPVHPPDGREAVRNSERADFERMNLHFTVEGTGHRGSI
jgi:hypothetical protein